MLRSREALLADWDRLDWRNKLDLLRRSLGAFRDALLLQPRRLEDEMFPDLRYGRRMSLMSVCLLFVITIVLFVCAATSYAQSADQIISRHLKAIGGENRIRRMESTAYSGVVTNPTTGESGRFALRFKRPDRLVTEMELGGFAYSAAYNGRSAWRRDPRDGLRTLSADEGARFKTEAVYRNDHFLNYKRDKARAALVGRAPAGGRDAFVVELTTQQAIKRKVYFDAQSYFILREEQAGANGLETISYDNYRPVDGLMEPHSLELRSGDSVLRVTVNQVEHNLAIDEAAFDYPVEAGASLPDIPTLLRELLENQERIERMLEDYTFTEEVIEREVNKKGALVETDYYAREIYFYKGHKIERVVKRYGKPLSKEEEAKEIKRVEKAIHEIDERAKKAAERQRQGQALDQPEESGRGQINITIGLFLRMCDFSHARRERYRGQEVIVFDFQPKPNSQARNLSEKFAQRMSGVTWVDENAKQIGRLEARLNEKLGAIGGVLTLKPGTAVVIEQTLVNNEIWLPSFREVNLSVRALLFAGINVNEVSRFSDYKKFKTDARSEIKTPEEKKPPE